jgi:hypothetical protein
VRKRREWEEQVMNEGKEGVEIKGRSIEEKELKSA